MLNKKNKRRQIFKGTVEELKQIAKSHGMFELEELDTIQQVRSCIKNCQSVNHVQQVAFSTYHDSLTQICFDCKKIVTNIKLSSGDE